ncbi:MAG: hypothetical protein Pg6C_06070 [Treponemataceae bacterium]|nr:MAG: hypothetical protein Pg6C_06070 [Treponemataceae bacterium]
MQIDFAQYKPRLKELLRKYGVDVSKGLTHCINPGGHKHGDANPSMQLFDESFRCHGCGIQGDIYDAVEILEGIIDKKAQFEFVEKLFGGGISVKPITPPKTPENKSGEDFAPDGEAVKVFEAYLRKHKSAAKMIKQFLDTRAAAGTNNAATAYPSDVEAFLIERLFLLGRA